MRAPLAMAGGTEFRFVTGGIHDALEQAKDAAGELDVRLGGGVQTLQQYFRAGLVDEAAVYNTALTASQIANHYVIGRAGTTALTITRAGSFVTITWPAGTTLQQSTAVSGPYADVPSSPVSPLSVAPSGTKFYRWRL